MRLRQTISQLNDPRAVSEAFSEGFVEMFNLYLYPGNMRGASAQIGSMLPWPTTLSEMGLSSEDIRWLLSAKESHDQLVNFGFGIGAIFGGIALGFMTFGFPEEKAVLGSELSAAKPQEPSLVATPADEMGFAQMKIAKPIQHGASAEKTVSSTAKDVIEFERLRAQYAEREITSATPVGSALKGDPYHRAASFFVEEIPASGRVFQIPSGSGSTSTLAQVEGVMNGQRGVAEWIVDRAGDLTHQRFIPGGKITGFANQRVLANGRIVSPQGSH
jgi:hypothetical protein